MEERTGDSRCCPYCKAPCSVGDFKKVVGLKNSGLLIYLHMDRESAIQCPAKKKTDKSFILHNAGDKELKKQDYIREICQYRTKCFLCKEIMKRVHSLLNEISDIEKNQVLGVCDHCKRPNPLGKCKRCEYIVNKFLMIKDEQRQNQQGRFDLLILKVNQLLRGVLECENIGKHRLSYPYDTKSLDELENLLEQLKMPVSTMRQLRIASFPKSESGQFVSLESLTQSKEILMDLILKIKSERMKTRISVDSLYVTTSEASQSCLCKNVRDKKEPFSVDLELKQSEEKLSKEISYTHVKSAEKTLSERKPSRYEATETSSKIFKSENVRRPSKTNLAIKSVNTSKSEKSTNNEKTSKAVKPSQLKKSSKAEKSSKLEKSSEGEKDSKPGKKPKTTKATKTPKEEEIAKAEKLLKGEKSPKSEKKTKDEKNLNEEKSQKAENSPKSEKESKPKMSPEDELMMKMMKERQAKRNEREKSAKPEKPRVVKELPPLPELKRRLIEEPISDPTGVSETVVSCDKFDYNRNEMIKGTSVIRFDPHYKDEPQPDVVPLVFEVAVAFSAAESASSIPTQRPSTIKPSIQNKKTNEEASTKGVITYELSNREFIDKGWTVLPTTKIMRKMNIYKMEPACPQYDWFERHKRKRTMYYDTGEKLAEIDSAGHGKWYYKNGIVALDYYNAEDMNAGQRYVVYSSGDDVFNGKKTPITILASFDFLGNGVVYDNYGHERLKYNQTEGAVLDEKIGPPSRWKWHSLNDPPLLQPVFVDTHVKESSPCLEALLKKDKDYNKPRTREPDGEMIAIEFENFVKEKAHKLMQKFKPYEIRMKALKINDHFSLRVINQANIYLVFRNGHTFMKLNLGMVLKSNEIVDTEIAEISYVATPYDRIPPRSTSLADIQRTIGNARRIGKMHESRNPVLSR